MNTMYQVLNLKEDINRLYVPRKEGRSLASLEDCIDSTDWKNTQKYKEKLITIASNNNDNTRTYSKTTKSRKKCEKQLYGYFKKQTGEITRDLIRTWKKKEKLQRKLNLFIEVQNNAIEAIYIVKNIDNT